MFIRFTCPRGHKMSAPNERAGKIGTCPKCETLFEVPTPGEDYEETEVLLAEEIIEFYCPNEHYLRSPARLQGKRGQCPECGSKFVVPSLDEDDDEGPLDPDDLEEIEEGDLVEDELDEGDLEEIEDAEPAEPPPPSGSGTGSGIEPPDFSFVDQQMDAPPLLDPTLSEMSYPEDGHPLAGLFERIWEEAPPEAMVELEMKSGERLAPLNYAHEASRGQFAVFAIQAPDGTHMVTIIAWEDVSRIVVRELKDLPPTMFN